MTTAACGCGSVPAPPDAHLCPACAGFVRADLAAVVALAAAARSRLRPRPRPGGARTVPGSRPPLDLAAVDPELTLVRLEPGDPTSAVPALTVLEDVERAVRAETGAVPLGLATTAGPRPAGRVGPGPARGTAWALERSARWLSGRAVTPWLTSGDVRLVTLVVRALRRWDPDPPEATWTVPCPTLGEAGDCGQPLRVARVAADEHVWCPACRRTWTTARLVLVAARCADAWVDEVAAAALSGVPGRTLRRWAAAGTVRRARGRYAVADLRAATPGPVAP